MQLFRCDKCGRETKCKVNPVGLSLWELKYNEWPVIADICDDCRPEFDELINKFIGHKVIEVGECIKEIKKTAIPKETESKQV
jgi:hypothetical protein